MCPICQSGTDAFAQSNNYTVYKCRKCGFGFTKNLKAQRGGYHRDETYIAEEALFKNIFQKRTNIICKLKKNGYALEIGCSTGLMLSLLKEKSWKVLGIEMSKKAAIEAQNKGIEVLIGDFHKLKIDKKFDLVIFNHTLEHLQNPIDALKKATCLLNKNGLLYVNLPNFDSLSAKIEKGRWPLLLPKEHLWHFTPKSLEILLRKFMLKTIFIEKSSGIWDYANPLKGIVISLFSFKKRFFKEILTCLPSLITSKLQLGSDLMIIAQKR